jgi:putative heme-binding domain-containing protein
LDGQTDPHLLAAVWSSVNPKNVASVVQHIVAQGGKTPLDGTLIDIAVKLLVEQGRSDDMMAAAATLSKGGSDELAPWKLTAATRLLEQTRGDATNSLALARQLEPVISQAKLILEDAEAEERHKLAALRLVAVNQTDRAQLLPVLEGLLQPQNPPALRQAAIELLATFNTREAGETILAPWRGYTADLRATAFDVVLGNAEFTGRLLELIAAGEIQPGDLDALQRQRLLDHADEAIGAQAHAALTGDVDADRQRIVEDYAAALNDDGDVGHGRQVFVKHCSSCHVLEGAGYAVGPDLAALTSREPKALLQSIFDPNRDIDERYRSYTALTIDGLSHAGILAGETSTSVTLSEQQGKRHTLLRADLEVFESSGKSLMPEGLERDISPADASALIAYLNSAGPQAKSIEGNEPVAITPDYDGTLWLLAASAEIYGEQITFEQPFQNIGYWHGENDYVAWQLKHPAGGVFDVYLHWACADDSAGNRFIIEGGEPRLNGVVAPTGGYDRFQTVRLGHVALPPEAGRIVVRPDGPLAKPHLMDLRGLYLVPRGANPERAIAGDAPANGRDAAVAIAKLLDGLAVGTPAEYERIPAIWHEAIAAGRRNQATELVRVLDLSLPKKGEPLRDWQAVVIGGGVINGMSQQGEWPRQRIAELLKPYPQLQSRWTQTLKLSAAMADDEAVKSGTRYDALRILGADAWERVGAKLQQYLGKDVQAELQMGAVSGLADVDAAEAASALLAAIVHLHEGNRRLAIQGMLRTEERRRMLAEAVESRALSKDLLTAEELAKTKAAH